MSNYNQRIEKNCRNQFKDNTVFDKNKCITDLAKDFGILITITSIEKCSKIKCIRTVCVSKLVNPVQTTGSIGFF